MLKLNALNSLSKQKVTPELAKASCLFVFQKL